MCMQAIIKVSVCREGKKTKKNGESNSENVKKGGQGVEEGCGIKDPGNRLTHNVHGFTLVTQHVA